MPRFGADPFLTGQDTPDLVDVGFGQAIGAAARAQFADNPTMLGAEASRLRAETTGREQDAPSLARYGRNPNVVVVKSQTLSEAEAKARIESEGLAGYLTVPKTGIPTDALDTLIRVKSAELRSNYLLDRYQGGIGGGAAVMGTRLAVGLADPLNIASAFVPVVGEARYARMLEQAGASLFRRGAVRTVVGGAEGAVGQAMLEPLYASSKFALQADYTTDDILRDIAFGGLFGSTLHAGAGGFGDLLAKASRTGAWAETINPDGTRHLPDLPEGAIPGGGTNFVHGADYVRGQYAVVDAGKLPSGAAPFEAIDTAQLGQSPYAGAGAPVLRPDGSIVDGSRRLSTVAKAYAEGNGEGYRQGLMANAEKYGIDSDAVAGMAKPVLVRVESGREAGAWDARLKEAGPAARAAAVLDEPPTVDEFLHGLRDEIGWDQRGGMMIRGGELADEASGASSGRASGDVVGRTPWVGKMGPDGQESSFWRHRPDPISEGQAHAALTKHAEGKTLGSREERFIEYARRYAKALHDDYMAAAAAGAESRATDNEIARIAEVRQAREDAMLASYGVTTEQADTAMRMGIAQAVNDSPVNVAAVAHLDGTPQGVEAFLSEMKAADAAKATELSERAANIDRLIAEAEKTDDAADVKEIESQLRAELKAAGHDAEDLDAALAEADALADDLKADAKAYQGIGMCLQRAA
jgi:hypothetical protein